MNGHGRPLGSCGMGSGAVAIVASRRRRSTGAVGRGGDGIAEDVEKRHGVKIDLVDDEADKPIDDATAALVYRAVRELLLNVVKHAKTSAAMVSLRRDHDHLAIEVEDAGAGFDPTDVMSGPEGRFGLFNVREQVDRLGGTVDVVSAPPRGTRSGQSHRVES